MTTRQKLDYYTQNIVLGPILGQHPSLLTMTLCLDIVYELSEARILEEIERCVPSLVLGHDLASTLINLSQTRLNYDETVRVQIRCGRICDVPTANRFFQPDEVMAQEVCRRYNISDIEDIIRDPSLMRTSYLASFGIKTCIDENNFDVLKYLVEDFEFAYPNDIMNYARQKASAEIMEYLTENNLKTFDGLKLWGNRPLIDTIYTQN